MAEEYKLIPKKVSEFPEASTINDSFVIGVDKEGKSVKVPIALLKGNQGDAPMIGENGNWWIGGKDTGNPAQGKDGEVTTEQLNEALSSGDNLATEEKNGLMSAKDKKQLNEIIDGMKAAADKYDVTAVLIMNNTEKGVSVPICTLTPIKAGVLDYKIVTKNYEISTSTTQRPHSTRCILSTENEVVKIYANNLSTFYTGNFENVVGLIISSKGDTLEQLDVSFAKFLSLDSTHATNIKRLYASNSLVEELKLQNSAVLDTLSGDNCANLKTVDIIGNNMVAIRFNTTPKFKSFNVKGVFQKLKELHINGAGLSKARLMELETIWTSRVGLDTGILEISQALYAELTAGDKKKFTDKNITIQF